MGGCHLGAMQLRSWSEMRSDDVVIARSPKGDAAIQSRRAPYVPWIASLRSQ
jgi:hypothetical protein